MGAECTIVCMGNESQIDPLIAEQLGRCILPLVAVTGDARWFAIGTAFVVALFDEGREALLLTAAHNVEAATKLDPYIQRPRSPIDDFAPPPVYKLGSTKMYVLTGRNTVASVGLASWHEHTDIALIGARIPDHDDDRFDKCMRLDTRPIADGTPLLALGCRSMAADFDEPPDYERARFNVRMTYTLVGRLGTVIRSVAREEVGRHAPGVLHSCRVDSGMSGGPIVEDGDTGFIVRAVASRSLSTEAETASGSNDHAFAETLLEALIIKAVRFACESAHGPLTEPLLLDLIRAGIVNDVGRAADQVPNAGATS